MVQCLRRFIQDFRQDRKNNFGEMQSVISPLCWMLIKKSSELKLSANWLTNVDNVLDSYLWRISKRVYLHQGKRYTPQTLQDVVGIILTIM